MAVRHVVLLVVVAVAVSGCLGSSAHGAPLTVTQAVATAKADDFTKVYRDPNPASWNCQPGVVSQGPPQTTGRYKSYLKPIFVLDMSDPKVHGGAPGPVIIVLPTALDAARCVRAEIQQAEHPPRGFKRLPYKVIDAATIDVAPHPAGSPGQVYAKATGDYQIFLSRGRVLALGEAFTQPDAAKAETDVSRLASQIAGS